MNRVLKVRIDVFQTDLWVFLGSKEDCCKALRKEGVNEDAIEAWAKEAGAVRNTLGLYLYNKKEDIALMWVANWPETIGDFVTVVHEGEHAAFYLLDRLGVEHTSASDEVYAYLQGYIYGQVMSYVSKQNDHANNRRS